jgi:riboflavin kinase/FMN adenylyltransferase
MQIIRNLNNIPSSVQDIILVLGNFDGVHLGHQELLLQAKNIAQKKAKKVALMTFEPHPLELLRDKKNIRITSIAQKISLIKDMGIDCLFIMRFNEAFAKLSAHSFLDDVLIKKLKINHLVIGHDFIFGKNRSGNAAYLASQAQQFNYDFSQVLPHKCPEYKIIYSSTQIRNNLQEGRVEVVKTLLGRYYNIIARVVAGDKIGREIGYKTANINLKNLLRIKYGVYAVKVDYDNNSYFGIANVGIRPTMKELKELLEVHIFDFDQDIYGEKINIKFVKFIRNEKKFNNKQELSQQIKQDCQQVKQHFNIII